MKALVAVISQETETACLWRTVVTIRNDHGCLNNSCELLSDLLNMPGAAWHVVIQDDRLLPIATVVCSPRQQVTVDIGAFDLKCSARAVDKCLH